MTFSLDYDQLASKYAQHRDIHPHVLPNLIASGEIADASQVLEVGCGTGNYIVALQEASGCIGSAVDPSRHMLAMARQRSEHINFQRGRAERLNFTSEVFDLVFTVDVIHHVADRLAYFREAHRVLKPGGRVCTVTDSEWIIHHRQPLSMYFPDTVAIDLRRFPPITELKCQMEAAGFAGISEKTVSLTYPLTDLQPYRDRAFSCLHFISEDALQRGIEWMVRDLRDGPIESIWRYVLLWGTHHKGTGD